jgi:signal peptidase I
MGSAYKTHYYNKRRNLFTHLSTDGLFTLSGDSMLPTLWNPCHVMVSPLHPTRDTDILSQVKVGDCVSFVLFFNDGKTKSVGKRIAGLPGDHVKTIEGKTVQVPDGCFWALGDNLGKSYDSRHYGAVPAANLKGKHTFRFTIFPPYNLDSGMMATYSSSLRALCEFIS